MRRTIAAAGALTFVFALGAWAQQSSQAQTGGQAGQEQGTTDQAWDASQIQTIRGQVVSIDRQAPDGEHVTVRKDDGSQVDVSLGPNWFLENQQDFDLKEGDTVEIRAYQPSGTTSWQAASITKGDQTLRLRDTMGNPYWGSTSSGTARNQESGESQYGYMAGCTPQQRAQAQQGWSRQGGYGSQYNPNTVQEFTGRIASIGTFDIAEEMSQMQAPSQIAQQQGRSGEEAQEQQQQQTGQQEQQGQAGQSQAGQSQTGQSQSGQQGMGGTMGQQGMGMMGTGMDVMLDTSDQGRLEVHLGPSWFMNNVGLNLQPGDQISVEGSLTNLNGRQVVLASQVTKGQMVVNLRDAQGNPCWMASRRMQR